MVSIIIPTYKRADYICRAIDSILNQKYDNFEIIVVDDNNSESQDRKSTETKMQKYRDNEKVIYIKHDKNMNGAAARNTGINKARGEYITFLDDDDYFLSDRLGDLVLALENNPNYDAAYSNCISVENKRIKNIYIAKEEGNLQYNMLIQNSNFKTGSNMFFRTSVLKELGGFDVRFTRHQDLEIMVRFFRNHLIKAVNSNTVVKDETSRINVPNVENAIKVREFYLKEFEDDIKKFSNSQQIYIKNYLNLLDKIDDFHSEEYLYIVNKLNEYGYKNAKPSVKKRLGKSNTFFREVYRNFRGRVKEQKITREEKKEIKNYLEQYYEKY